MYIERKSEYIDAPYIFDDFIRVIDYCSSKQLGLPNSLLCDWQDTYVIVRGPLGLEPFIIHGDQEELKRLRKELIIKKMTRLK